MTIRLPEDAEHVFTLPPGETVVDIARFQDTILVVTAYTVYQIVKDEQIGFIVKRLTVR